jgi:hypothetical protein
MILSGGRLLRRLHTQISVRISCQLPGAATCCAVPVRCIPSIDLSKKRRLQPCSSISALEVSSLISEAAELYDHRSCRPKEHHVFDVLHWVKAAFKKHALDEMKASDCLNKEAFR